MKRASDVLESWRKRYAAICPKHEGGFEKMPPFCWCESAAQVAAHIETVIPDDYQKFEISDFTGVKKGESKKLISDKVVIAARTAVVDYCWEGIDPDEVGNFDLKQWYPKSAMEKRRKLGQSVVIYGDPIIREIRNGLVKVTKKSLGRTMLAAVVMKEAIRMRLRSFHQGDTYAWVNNHRLCTKLMQQAQNENAFDDEIADYEEADWLCVDGIEVERGATEAAKSFRTRVLDNFFDERIRSGRPNILVFQDDLGTVDDLRAEFGISITSIINSNKTVQIKLLEGK
jgi:hypothetical protein